MQLGSTLLDCNTMDIDGETNSGLPFTSTDLGGNSCGCGPESREGVVLSSNHQAPAPLE